MKIKIFVLILTFVIISSCKKEDNYKDTPYEAVVSGKGTICNDVLLTFLSKTNEVSSICGSSLNDTYIATGKIDKEFVEVGIKVRLAIRKPDSTETAGIACVDTSIKYKYVYITKLKI